MDMNRILQVFIGAVLFLSSCSTKDNNETSVSPEMCLTDSLMQVVSIDTVHTRILIDELTLNGRVAFNQEQVVQVFPMFGGRVIAVNAEVGDYVHKGEVLAVVKSGEVAEYEKQLKDAEQQVAVTRRNWDVAQDMYNAGMASARDTLQARQELVSAVTEERRLKEVYSIYNLSDESRYEIKSPITGFVVEKHVNKDMQIRSDQGEELFTVSGLDNVWIMGDVYESDIRKVKEGAPVRITALAYPGREFTGVIDKVYHILDEESKTMSVRIKLRNEDYLLKPGMFTNVYVQCESTDDTMPCIDLHALIFENGKNYVVTASEDGRLQVKEVEVYKQLRNRCYIHSGLQEGDRLLRIDGEKVYVYSDISLLMGLNKTGTFDLQIERNGEVITLRDFTMERREYTDQNGKAYTGYGLYFGAEEATLGRKLSYSWNNAMDFARLVRLSLQMLVTGQAGVKDLSGPVGIVSTMTQVGEQAATTRAAVENIAYLAALIAVNLAVMNLLPLPALDGGKIFFLVINAVSMQLFKKQIPAKYENYIHFAGLILLLALMAVITFSDVWKLIH